MKRFDQILITLTIVAILWILFGWVSFAPFVKLLAGLYLIILTAYTKLKPYQQMMTEPYTRFFDLTDVVVEPVQNWLSTFLPKVTIGPKLQLNLSSLVLSLAMIVILIIL